MWSSGRSFCSLFGEVDNSILKILSEGGKGVGAAELASGVLRVPGRPNASLGKVKCRFLRVTRQEGPVQVPTKASYQLPIPVYQAVLINRLNFTRIKYWTKVLANQFIPLSGAFFWLGTLVKKMGSQIWRDDFR